MRRGDYTRSGICVKRALCDIFILCANKARRAALRRRKCAKHGEQRFFAYGMSSYGRMLTVIWTPRGERIRIISAFKATKELRRLYERANNTRTRH
ncbi:MAG: BrnT family toxin [Rhodocyclaceae bacterium]|nr:BrnT family toxin [Rhodocyclaceae bacterium]